MRPRAILLDLDGTLLDFDDSAWEGVVRRTVGLVARLGNGVDEDALAEAYERISLGHRADDGGTSVPDGFDLWREHWRRALAEQDQDSARNVRLALHTYRAARLRGYALFDDSLETVEALRRQGLKLGIVTNGPADTQQDKLAEVELPRLVDAVVVSGEVGVAKPDAGIFAHVLDRLGVAPSAAWHVGDNLMTDVLGAHNAGLGAGVWLNRTGSRRPDGAPAPTHELRALTELPALLSRQA